MTKTVLVADDDKDVLDVVKERLESKGYRVIAISDSSQALDMARTSKPDAVILDILMPGMDGATVAASMKIDTDTRNIPVIFLTGFIDKEKEGDIRKKLMSSFFLSKPFNGDELLAIVEKAIQSKSEQKS